MKGLIERVAPSQENPASEPDNVDANMDVEEEEEENADYGFEDETKIEDETQESEDDADEVNEEEEMVNDLLAKSLGADAAKKEAERNKDAELAKLKDENANLKASEAIYKRSWQKADVSITTSLLK